VDGSGDGCAHNLRDGRNCDGGRDGYHDNKKNTKQSFLK
jgi:hypothetical protein